MDGYKGENKMKLALPVIALWTLVILVIGVLVIVSVKFPQMFSIGLKDSDGDGVSDQKDKFPDDPTEWDYQVTDYL